MRGRLLLALLLVTPLGFASKLYAGPGASWVNHYAGGVLYEIFWVLLALLPWPAASPVRVALGVFVATSLLETLQLWHPPWLEALRRSFLGGTLLGSTFSAWDFPHYAVGCALAVVLARALQPGRAGRVSCAAGGS